MSENGFEMLSEPPKSPDLKAELKTKGGNGVSKVTLGLGAVVLLVGAFVGGIAVGKSNASTTPAASSTRTRGNFTGGFGGAGGTGATGGTGGTGTAGRGGVTGTITAINGTTITVTDSTGKVTTVDTDPTTTITVAKTGAITDLATGTQVTVIGTTGSDGTVTARSVVSGLTGFGFGRGGFGGGRPTTAPTTSG